MSKSDVQESDIPDLFTIIREQQQTVMENNGFLSFANAVTVMTTPVIRTPTSETRENNSITLNQYQYTEQDYWDEVDRSRADEKQNKKPSTSFFSCLPYFKRKRAEQEHSAQNNNNAQFNG